MKSNFIKVISLALTMAMIIASLPMTVSATQSMTANFYTTFSLSGDPATDVVRVAEAQLGRNRASMGYTEAWCADFVNDCAKLINIPDNVIPHNYAYRGSCGYLIRYMLNYCNATLVTTPQTGDMVFWHCTVCDLYPHVGFVYDSLHSIEGNGAQGYVYSENGHVIKRTLASSNTAVHSCGATLVKKYVRPNYSSVLSATLDAQGGECKDACQYLKYGGYIGTLPTPVREGYTFNGWFSEKNGQGSQYTSDLVFWGLTDVTWYASWTANGNVDNGETTGNISWRIDANGTLYIEGTGEMTDTPWKDQGLTYTAVVIGEGITSVADKAFFVVNGLKNATLPSTMKKIGTYAFAGCSNLKTINLPSGLEEIGARAFLNTSSIASLQIPESVIFIGDYAFSNCPGITSVTLSDKLKYVGEGAFECCDNLLNIIIENGITEIPEYIFCRCAAVTSITIPSSVTTIGQNAFIGCTSLTDVYVSVTENEWESNVTVATAFPETVTFHYKESYLDFKVIENESNTVTLSWNRDEYSYAYDVSIYDEVGFLLECHSIDAEDAVDGVVTTTFNLRGGNYKAEIVCLNTAGIIITEEVTFTVEATDADNYSIDALNGSVSEGRFYAEVEVVNLTDRDVADTVIIAVYKDGEMIDYVYMKTDLPQGQTVTFGGMLQGCEGAVLKAFVWDSINGMKALSNVVEK